MKSQNRRYMPLHALPTIFKMPKYKKKLEEIYQIALWFSHYPQKLLNHYFEVFLPSSDGQEEEMHFTFEEAFLCLQGIRPWIHPETGDALDIEIGEENLFPYFTETELLREMSDEWKIA
jgi:hypothetical protein